MHDAVSIMSLHQHQIRLTDRAQVVSSFTHNLLHKPMLFFARNFSLFEASIEQKSRSAQHNVRSAYGQRLYVQKKYHINYSLNLLTSVALERQGGIAFSTKRLQTSRLLAFDLQPVTFSYSRYSCRSSIHVFCDPPLLQSQSGLAYSIRRGCLFFLIHSKCPAHRMWSASTSIIYQKIMHIGWPLVPQSNFYLETWPSKIKKKLRTNMRDFC